MTWEHGHAVCTRERSADTSRQGVVGLVMPARKPRRRPHLCSPKTRIGAMVVVLYTFAPASQSGIAFMSSASFSACLLLMKTSLQSFSACTNGSTDMRMSISSRANSLRSRNRQQGKDSEHSAGVCRAVEGDGRRRRLGITVELWYGMAGLRCAPAQPVVRYDLVHAKGERKY